MQKQSVWETNLYYDKAKSGSLDLSHPGMKLLLNLAKSSKSILDLGCGEGTRLSEITSKGTGIDISKTAIANAKKNYTKLNFFVGDLEDLPFKNDSFDLVYSAYVFEHLDNPEKVIKEARRVLKPQGNLVIICPNYGAPNRSSPPFVGSRIKKLISGLLKDFYFKNQKLLGWTKVEPIASKNNYESDWDVTIEPYARSLGKFLNNNGFKVTKNIQAWEHELGNAKTIQKIFRFLASLNIYPFNYWSPHIVIQAKKVS